MSEFMNSVGENIKRIRTSRNITQKELADMYSEKTGVIITANMISMWESGQRNIYAEQLYYICRCLEITPTYISPKPGTTVYLQDELGVLRDQERSILQYMFNEWDGDTKAMIHFIGLYMSLPRQLRQDIAGMGVHMYQLGVKEHRVDKEAPYFDIDYVEKATDKLWKWRQNEL